MSGAGRKTQYRKSVTDDFLHSDPVPGENEFIMEVVESRGSNIFEVKAPDGKKELTMLPKKFHKLIWVKRGEFLIVLRESGDEQEGGVKSMIQHVLNKDHIKNLETIGLWPAEFLLRSSNKHESYSNADIMPDYADDEDDYDQQEEGDDGEQFEEEVDAKGRT